MKVKNCPTLVITQKVLQTRDGMKNQDENST